MTAGIEIDDALLRNWPLPATDGAGDKESRGQVLIIAGSREMPGAAVLCATAALRAGAGKLVVATPQSAAPIVAAGVPEARVIALPESAGGGPLLGGLDLLAPLTRSTPAVLVGPGMTDEDATLAFVRGLLPMFTDATVMLDALAMDCVLALRRFEQSIVMTPHAGELAHLSELEKEDVLEQPEAAAARQAARWNAVVAVKGAQTCVARPGGGTWRHEAELPGLGMSGSGDVLAGVIAGLLARGAPPPQAAAWGVALHARAGAALAQRMGTVGYLARELAAEIPALMDAFARPTRPDRSAG